MRLLVLTGAAVAASFVALMLWTTSGHFVPQIADLYVVAQYARAMAEGHPFRYYPGDAPTTGSTSLLYTAVLAAAHALGARGEGLIAFAILLGGALLVASIPLAVRVGTRLAGRREGLLGGALVALGGPVAWSYLYGSDIALALFLALLLLDRWLAWWEGGPVAGFAAATVLLALARPEGIVLGAALGAASLLRRPPERTIAGRLLPWCGLGAGLAVLALQRALTGTWVGTSVAGKSLLANYGPAEGLAVAAKYGVDTLRGLLLGFYPSEAPIGFWPGEAAFAFPPLGLAFVLLAVPAARAAVRRPAFIWLAATSVAFALASPTIYAGVHFNRYILWAFPGLLVYAAAGVGAAARLLSPADSRLERALFGGAAGLFVVLATLSTARYAAKYAQGAGVFSRREVPMAAWIRANLPPGVAIASASTSVEYLTGHRNLNLHGVTSAQFTGGRSLDRHANVLEQLRTLPAADRPPYLLVSRADLDAAPLLRAYVEGPPVHETASLADDDLLLMKTRWDILDRGLAPVLPNATVAIASLIEVDRLDVGDPEAEAAHGYEVDSRAGELPVGATVEMGPAVGPEPIADAGRFVLGSETFHVLHTRAGRDLVVVMRTRTPAAVRFLREQGVIETTVALAETALEVRAGGRVAGRVRLANREGWNEHVFRVPASAVADGSTALELSGRYASFRFWFYQ